MIFLKTGSPGASKTLNAIKFLCEDSRFQNRQVYYYGVNKLNNDKLDWIKLTKEEAINWFELPSGSVILVDEAQKLWRPRKTGSPVPESVQMMETNRHGGYDLVFTCQYPRQIDIGVRRMVNEHFHYFRPYGLNTVSLLKFEKCIDDPEDRTARSMAQKSRLPIDEKYFDYYQSAEVHTVKKSLPKKLWLFPALIAVLILLVFLIVSLFSGMGPDSDSDATAHVTPQQNIHSPSPRTSSKNQLYDSENPFKTLTPRIENDPKSAPIYDEAREVVSYPRLQCVQSTETREGSSAEFYKCRCYTQQATRASVTQQACMRYVNNGYDFDPSIPDPKPSNRFMRIPDFPIQETPPVHDPAHLSMLRSIADSNPQLSARRGPTDRLTAQDIIDQIER